LYNITARFATVLTKKFALRKILPIEAEFAEFSLKWQEIAMPTAEKSGFLPVRPGAYAP
jgi:hypothetical protein